MAGGPEPADGGWLLLDGIHGADWICFTGRLNVINLHGGASADCVGLSFGTAMRIPYKHAVLPVFGQFLKLCYSKYLHCCELTIVKLPSQLLKNANLEH